MSSKQRTTRFHNDNLIVHLLNKHRLQLYDLNYGAIQIILLTYLHVLTHKLRMHGQNCIGWSLMPCYIVTSEPST